LSRRNAPTARWKVCYELDNLSDALLDPDGTTWVALGKIVSDLD
jgi:hypothetical protein